MKEKKKMIREEEKKMMICYCKSYLSCTSMAAMSFLAGNISKDLSKLFGLQALFGSLYRSVVLIININDNWIWSVS